MLQYFTRRVLYLIPVLFVMSILIFSMVHLAPGDPVLVLLNSSERAAVSPEMIEAVTKELGLDKPLYQQYLVFLGGLLRGDLGTSYQLRKPVLEVVSDRIWPTIQLALSSIVVSLLLSVPLGIISAMRRGSLIDNVTMAFAVTGVSTPNFWFGLILILLFAVKLGWLPSFGIGYMKDGIGSVLAHLLLPSLTLGLSLMAIVTRMTRSSLLEVLGMDYVQTARAKGLAESVVLRRHALRSAIIPVITVVGLQFGALLGGSVITETIFAWPGIGRLMITAIQRRDFPLVQGLTLIFTFSFLLINLIVDLTYSFCDPRIRYD